jgi:hypothetical protein
MFQWQDAGLRRGSGARGKGASRGVQGGTRAKAGNRKVTRLTTKTMIHGCEWMLSSQTEGFTCVPYGSGWMTRSATEEPPSAHWTAANTAQPSLGLARAIAALALAKRRSRCQLRKQPERRTGTLTALQVVREKHRSSLFVTRPSNPHFNPSTYNCPSTLNHKPLIQSSSLHLAIAIPLVFTMAERYIPEHRRTQFKAKNTFKPDELRRRREEQQVEIRKAKREENLAKRRGITTRDGNIGVGGPGQMLGAAADSDDESGSIESEVRPTPHPRIVWMILLSPWTLPSPRTRARSSPGPASLVPFP